MPKLFDSRGAEVGREYYTMINSAWDGHVFAFSSGAKVVFARKYGGMGFDRIWESANGGLEVYEHYRRTGDLPE